jgi:hypothetical protein
MSFDKRVAALRRLGPADRSETLDQLRVLAAERIEMAFQAWIEELSPEELSVSWAGSVDAPDSALSNAELVQCTLMGVSRMKRSAETYGSILAELTKWSQLAHSAVQQGH